MTTQMSSMSGFGSRRSPLRKSVKRRTTRSALSSTTGAASGLLRSSAKRRETREAFFRARKRRSPPKMTHTRLSGKSERNAMHLLPSSVSGSTP